MTTTAERPRAETLVIDAAIVCKETDADTFCLRITGSYPDNEAHRWEHRLHPARLFALLERYAQPKE